ncbi:DUF5018 domain-containing protein [Paraflavitalea pollutisoli]|uniref:DUF5018 domain-containing protein n=1 Tax=Paraflavitalea pollutisoli TaxID=3034143 RepID=UPI0023ED0A4F|nr:DUF5018 domain-containing protein [Paraflavitalea sp. H1-2-19X]
MKKTNLTVWRLFLSLCLFVSAPGCSKDAGEDSTNTRPKSSEKAITAFSFSLNGTTVNATITGTSITATVPHGTAITALTPTITLSAKASISPQPAQARDFSKAVTYTVTAEDNSQQTYTVTVSVEALQPLTIDCNNVPAVWEDRGDGIDYIVSCAIVLKSNKTLTIKPGVRIQFNGEAAGITISSSDEWLKMVGTAAKPILLEGKTATAGSWMGVKQNSKHAENQWEYVTIQHAGAGANNAALFFSDNAYFLNNSKITIRNCTFKDNKGYGIRDEDNGYSYDRTIFTAFSNNSFSGNTTAPLCITINEIGSLDAPSNYGTNGNNYIEVHGKSGLRSNVTIPKLSVPYYIFESIGLYQKMTVSPGVTMQFHTDAGLNLDKQYIGKGTFIANGTAANPIRLVGYKAGKGVWLGLQLESNDPEISLNYCTVDGAGSNLHSNAACVANKKAALNFGSCDYTAKPVATNCTITNSGGYGIIYKKTAVVNFTGNSYSGNTLANEVTF